MPSPLRHSIDPVSVRVLKKKLTDGASDRTVDGALKGVAWAQGEEQGYCSPWGVLAAGSCHPWLEGARGVSVYTRREREAGLQVRLTFTRGSWYCQHSSQQRGSQRDVETCSALLLLWCSLVVQEARSSMLPSEVRAGRRRLEPGQGCPHPLRGNLSQEVALLSLPTRSMFAPGGTGAPFSIFSVYCLPTYALTWAPSLILCAFLIWKQPNIPGISWSHQF